MSLTDASTATRDRMQKLYNKTYIKERRVTTVEEQQTWEDLEDDYDQNEKNIID